MSAATHVQEVRARQHRRAVGDLDPTTRTTEEA